MEAVGAAGAIVGLAGSALTGLRSLGEFINILQEGKVDVESTQRRLVEHEFRLSELRNEYDALPNGAVTTEEKLLLDDCIKDSHDELQRYQRLLEILAKTRTRGKNLQKLESAFRMYLHGEDFKKHRSAIQDRTLRLQAYSERANRVRVSESFQRIVSSTAQYHAEDMTAHNRTVNAVNEVSDRFGRHLQQYVAANSSLEAHVTAVVGSYNEQMQTLIQSSHHSTVQQVNDSMEQHILPMIRGLLDGSRNGDQALGYQNRRRSAHRSRPNTPPSDAYDKELLYPRYSATQSVYRTPFGRLRVAYTYNDRQGGDSHIANLKAAYWIRFDPYSCFSPNFVEWRLFFNKGPSSPLTTIWCDIGTLCEDSEVLDALGLIRDGYRCNHRTDDIGVPTKHTNACRFTEWRTKPPDPYKLKHLLDERRFNPGDSLRDLYGGTQRILDIFVSAHYRPCETPHQPVNVERFGDRRIHCFCEARHLIKNGQSNLLQSNIIIQANTKVDKQFEYLSHFYPRYYNTLKLLFEIGCKPENWGSVHAGVAHNTYHILEYHTRYASADYFRLYSAITLVKNAAARPLHTQSFFSTGYGRSPSELCVSGAINFWRNHHGLETFTGNLLPFIGHFQQHLEDLVFELGGAEALDKDLQYDRWLLVLMSHIEPRLQTLLTASSGSSKRNKVLDFSIERACEEIRSAPECVQLNLADYIVYHGNCSLVQLLLQKGFDPLLLFDASARRGDLELLDIVMESCLKTSSRPAQKVIHHYLISARIAQDPSFATRLLDLLVPESLGISHQDQTLDGFFTTPNHDGYLRSSLTVVRLMSTTSSNLPEYIRLVFQGCITRYEQAHCRFLGVIRLYIRYGLCAQHDFEHHRSKELNGTREDLGVFTHSYHEILHRLVSSPVFRCGLEYVPNGESPSEEPGTEHYTPLMMALHGGMIPAVEILLAAGAEIDSRASCGMTALQLAEQNSSSSHPRACWGSSQHDFSEVRSSMWSVPQLVSSNVDDKMLEMLRNALRSRRQRVPDPSPPMASKPLPHWLDRVFWRILGRVMDFLGWLFHPAVRMTMTDLRERLIYTAVVWTFGLLSVARLLHLEMGNSTADMLTGILKLLSRPVVLIPVAAYVIRAIWRYFFAAME